MKPTKSFKMLTISAAIIMSCQASAGQVRVVDVDTQDNVSWKKNSSKLIQNKSELIKGSEIPIDDKQDTHQIGNGYDSVKELSKGASSFYITAKADGTLAGDSNNDRIDDSATLIGNTEAHFSVLVDASHKSVLDSITGGASADLKFSSVDVSGNIAIANEAAADSYVGTYTLFARVKPEKAVMLPEVESEGGVAASLLTGTGTGLQPTSQFTGWQGVVGNGEPLMNKVGDEFIHAVEYGSWLMVTLKFEYRNAQDKKDIGGQLSVNWAGGVDASGSANFSSIDNASTVNVTISAYQYGGESQDLTAIIPNNLLSCRLNNPTDCFDLFSNTVSYMKNDYPAQFKNPDGSLNLGQFNKIRYFTERYDESGPEWTDYMTSAYDEMTFASRQALRDAHSRWERALLDKRRANYLIAERSNDLSSAQLSKVTAIESLADDNATDLATLVNQCLDNAAATPSYCATNWANQTFFKSYDETALEY
jgi:hypothetical protein